MAPIGGADGIGWDENVPADTESLGLTDDRIRSIKTTLRQVLDSEHNYPSAGGDDVGYHRYGSARPYYGTQSVVSSSGTDGRLMVTSDTSRIFGVGSDGTMYLGGARGSEIIDPSITQRQIWIEQWGYGITASSGTTLLTLPQNVHTIIPALFLTSIYTNTAGNEANDVPKALSYRTVNAQTMVVRSHRAATEVLTGGVAFLWRSLGTANL